MKKQVIVIAIIIFLICAGLTLVIYNPFNKEENKFIGVWKGTIHGYVFLSDSTFSEGASNGTWEIKDGKLVLILYENTEVTYSYVFSNGDRTLALTSIEGSFTEILTKQ